MLGEIWCIEKSLKILGIIENIALLYVLQMFHLMYQIENGTKLSAIFNVNLKYTKQNKTAMP